jgi:predicted transcriptional regulator/transcriptional regulator with XRE-family HTH domain
VSTPAAAGAATSRKGLGARIRALRHAAGLSQVDLAKQVGISASYLNLIEHNQRALTAKVLGGLAQTLQIDPRELRRAPADDLTADLGEAFADPLFANQPPATHELRDLALGAPQLSRAVLALYRAFVAARDSAESLAMQIYDGQQIPQAAPSRLPSEEVSDFIQRAGNHFPQLEACAEHLWDDADLSADDLMRGLIRRLTSRFGITVDVRRETGALRRFDPAKRLLVLSSELPPTSRTFQLAVQLALVAHGPLLDEIARGAGLASDASRKLCRIVLANYFAGAVVMPYASLLEAAVAERYDIELLGHRFGASFEQVCHRLTTLRRPGAEGIALHMIRVDLAGNISKRFSASGIRFARFAGACPRWNVFGAFSTPGAVRVQVSEMPDGERFFCVARTVHRVRGGYHAPRAVQAIGLGCELRHASELVYADGVDLADREGATPIGVTCRLCPREDCEQRAFPSIRDPLVIDDNVRRGSIFAPPETKPPGARRP